MTTFIVLAAIMAALAAAVVAVPLFRDRGGRVAAIETDLRTGQRDRKWDLRVGRVGRCSARPLARLGGFAKIAAQAGDVGIDPQAVSRGLRPADALVEQVGLEDAFEDILLLLGLSQLVQGSQSTS